MSLKRITYKVFGQNASPQGDNANGAYIGQFGSAAAGTFQGTNDPAQIMGLPAWQNGWIDATSTNSRFPALPERTGVDFVQSYGLNYLYNEGIPLYDEGTTYPQGGVCKLPTTTDASVKVSVGGTLNISNVTVNATQFGAGSAVNGTSGTYIFNYNGSDWTINSQTISNITTDYGITITSIPNDGDNITVIYTPATVALNLYKSLQDNNVGNEPTSSPYWWAGWDFGSSGAGLPIGAVYALVCSDTYIPDGALPCSGGTYSSTQFSEFVTNYLDTGYLKTCTLEEYNNQIATYGSCGMFGYESGGTSFRVPTIKDGQFIQQAQSAGTVGQSYNAGLPNITGYKTVAMFTGGVQNGALNVSTSLYNVGATSGGNLGANNLTFDASNSNSIYGNSDTVQPNAVALRYFVQVANGQINQSDMDWSAWASGLANKVDLDAQNLSNEGTSYISGLSAPSSKYIDLTLGSSGTTYTAPANGWLYLQMAYVADKYLDLYNQTSRSGQIMSSASAAVSLRAMTPCLKGDSVTVNYTATTKQTFIFIYAQGAQND